MNLKCIEVGLPIARWKDRSGGRQLLASWKESRKGHLIILYLLGRGEEKHCFLSKGLPRAVLDSKTSDNNFLGN